MLRALVVLLYFALNAVAFEANTILDGINQARNGKTLAPDPVLDKAAKDVAAGNDPNAVLNNLFKNGYNNIAYGSKSYPPDMQTISFADLDGVLDPNFTNFGYGEGNDGSLRRSIVFIAQKGQKLSKDDFKLIDLANKLSAMNNLQLQVNDDLTKYATDFLNQGQPDLSLVQIQDVHQLKYYSFPGAESIDSIVNNVSKDAQFIQVRWTIIGAAIDDNSNCALLLAVVDTDQSSPPATKQPTNFDNPPANAKAPTTDIPAGPADANAPPTNATPATDAPATPTDAKTLPADANAPATDTPTADAKAPPAGTNAPTADVPALPVNANAPPADTNAPATDAAPAPTDANAPAVNDSAQGS